MRIQRATLGEEQDTMSDRTGKVASGGDLRDAVQALLDEDLERCS